MALHRKIARVIADQGLRGLLQTLMGKLSRRVQDSHTAADEVSERHKAEYEESVRQFHEKALALGHADIKQYYWYHTVDLRKDGLITPGDYDYRHSVHSFGFPTSMVGMNVLDVGSATGFFAFEFEKRGARVVSVELPSIADWDMPTGADRESTLRLLMNIHGVDSVEAVHHYHLDGPFEFCRRALGSGVKRVYSSVYDLSAQRLGRHEFDMVYLGDVLLHTFAPLKALAAIAPLCANTLIIMEHLADERKDAAPLMYYAGGATPDVHRRTWWYPNKVCMEQMLGRLGFKTVEVVAHPDIFYRPTGQRHRTAVIHAHK